MEKRHFGSFPAQMEMRLIEATGEAARDRQNQPTTSPPLRPAQWTMQRVAEALNVAQSTISDPRAEAAPRAAANGANQNHSRQIQTRSGAGRLNQIFRQDSIARSRYILPRQTADR